VSERSNWGYRPALDGVRAIAVYLVVLFHAGVGMASGGFVGVDLFFVLSGFLVTNILLAEMDTTGRIRLSRFYARRIRRLLPAAIVLIVATAFMYLLVAPVTERIDLVRDARSALLYVANWNFIDQAQDYFATDAAESPYVHFWSLSIEEQFFAVFPLVLIGLNKLRARTGPHTVAIGLGVLFAASLASQLYWAGTSTVHAYYGTDARLYQMLAGALLAVLGQKLLSADGPAWMGQALPVVGIASLLLVGSDVLDLSPSTRGIVATVCSLAVIAGLERGRTSATASVLSRPLPVYLGRISYGTYLWHWPLILVFGKVLEVGPWTMAVLATVASTAMAALSVQVVEMPIRQSKQLDGVPRITIAAGLAVSVVVALAIPLVLESERKPVIAATGAPVEVSAEFADLGPVPTDIDFKAIKDDIADISVCDASTPQDCTLVEGDGPSILLVGDSTALTMLPVMTALAEEKGFTFSANVRSACSWYIGARRPDRADQGADNCLAERDEWYEEAIPILQPDVVMLMQRTYRGEKWERDLRAADPAIDALDLHGREAALTESTLDVLTGLGPQVVVVEPVATGFDVDPTECLAGAREIAECVFVVPDGREPVEKVLRDLADASPTLHTIDLDRVVCPTEPECSPIVDGEIVWRDETHVLTWFWEAQSEALWARLVETGALEP
jgi:peptidoglycan/LPS O-acetylase OafA/YrhL